MIPNDTESCENDRTIDAPLDLNRFLELVIVSPTNFISVSAFRNHHPHQGYFHLADLLFISIID